ncbi:MAG: hypothetical protein WCJ09_14700 [Planctomycetota bacterium]
MITASELAGMFAAHAIWCVSDGDTLIPMLAYTNDNDQRQMERLAHEDLGAAVESGKLKLATNAMDANDAALIYDGRIKVGNEKLDAIIIELRAYFSPDSTAIFAVPYTPGVSGRFRVHKPKVLAWENCDDFDLGQAIESFFTGVAGHEKGAAIWNECLDESK